MRLSNIGKSLFFVLCAINLYAQDDMLSYKDSTAQMVRPDADMVKIIDTSKRYGKSYTSYIDESAVMRGVVQDDIIDSSKYIVGPGDVFNVSMWGMEKKQILITISPEGFFIMPMVGSVCVCRLPLDSAKEKILNKINEVYRTQNISVSLQRLRTFKTYINGEVEKQGSLIVDGNTRISDIIAMAGGIRDGGSKRGIIIKNDRTSDVKHADLVKAEKNSDFSLNPYISEGDRVYVPPRKQVVYIAGSVSYPGLYDYLTGDNVLQLINIAGGFSRDADTSRIFLYKYCGSDDSTKITELNYSDASSVLLEPEDRIFVRTRIDYPKTVSVYLKGEVYSPGEYPIIKGKTRLSDILKKAGGLKPSADLNASCLIRSKYKYPGEYQFSKIKRIPPKVQYPLEQDYYITKSTESRSTVSINFNDLRENGENDILLDKNDTIEIPEKTSSVKVIGAVLRPGLVALSANREADYYIEKCGGFTRHAKKRSIRVITHNNDNLEISEIDKIEAGYVIWVPEKRYVDRVQVTKDWVLFVSAIATTLLAFFALRDYTK